VVVSESDVIAAFRLILGREPESAEAVRALIESHATIAELRARFLNSEEFKIHHAASLKPLGWGRLDVDIDVPEPILQDMLARVERLFKQLGDTEPHWSVLTDEKFKAANIGEHEDEFFGSGFGDVENFRATAERCGVSLKPDGICFELGCGVGRVTLWLAKHFAKVIAADLSAPHLEILRRKIEQSKLSNIEPLLLNTISKLDQLPAFDAFFTIIVLQHNPPPVMAYFLRKMLGKLKVDGVGYFQLPTYRPGYSFNAAAYVAKPQVIGDPEMHVIPQHQLYQLIENAGCRLLEVREDDSTGPGFISSRVLVQKRS